MMLSGKLHTDGYNMFGPDAPEYVCAILDFDTRVLMVFTKKSTETHILGVTSNPWTFKWSKTMFHYGENPIVSAMESIKEQYKEDGESIPDGVRALEL